MAGDNPKPASSSADRKSRWESSSSSAGKSSKLAAGDSKTSNRPSSDKPTPKRGPNASPRNPIPMPSPSQGRGPILPPGPNFPFPDPSSLGPVPPPTYGFQMLDRRSIVLADGSVRSYFALPHDYQDLPLPPRPPLERFMPGGPELGRFPPHGPMSPDEFRKRDEVFGRNRGSQEYWNSLGLDGPRLGPGHGPGPEGSMKRKFGEGEERDGRDRDEFARQRQQLLQYGNAGADSGMGTSSPFMREDEFRSSKFMKVGGGAGGVFENNNVGIMRQDVDPAVLKAFLNFAKLLNENVNQRRNYLENGKHGPLQCIACGRSSKDFQDVHGLIMHTYSSDNAALRVDHLGLHRALCVLMGWSYLRPPDNSKVYQFLPADEAAANQDDLILWPPMVIIHNTNTGKGKDGRMEGMGNKMMDNKIRDLGFPGGKSKSLYSKEGHLGITLIKFASDEAGLKEAIRLANHFVNGRHGRRDWAHVQSINSGRDDENNPNLVVVDERTGERRRILYGYLGTVSDIDKLDYETRKKVAVESRHEKLKPSK